MTLGVVRRGQMPMTITTTTVRRGFASGFAAVLLTGLGCSGGGGGGVTTPMPQLTCTDDGPPAPNEVAMRCGGVAAGVTHRVNVVIGGPEVGSTTLRGLNFDVLYDPSKLEFISVTADMGQLFPSSAFVLGVLHNHLPGRVVVSIHQAGGLPDVAVSAGQRIVLSVSFQRVAGETFGPTPVQFDTSTSEATDASTTISFAGGAALAHQ